MKELNQICIGLEEALAKTDLDKSNKPGTTFSFVARSGEFPGALINRTLQTNSSGIGNPLAGIDDSRRRNKTFRKRFLRRRNK